MKARARAKNTSVPEETRQVETAFLRCPSGHALPFKGESGDCSPVYCANSQVKDSRTGVSQRVHKTTAVAKKERLGKKVAKAKRREKKYAKAIRRHDDLMEADDLADMLIDQMIPGTSAAADAAREAARIQKVEELVKLGHAVGRFAAARSFFKVPEGLEGADAEAYVQKRALQLAPEAMLVLERALKLGDLSDQKDAARDILDMVGLRKKESTGGSAPVIMLVNPTGQGVIQVPWAQRATTEAKVLAAQPQTIGALPRTGAVPVTEAAQVTTENKDA